MNKEAAFVVVTPICNFCAKTGVLCKKCKQKLRKGKITELEITVSKAFAKADQKYPKILQNVVLYRAHSLDSSTVLLTRNGDVILENEELTHFIESEIRNPVEIVERKSDTRKTFTEFFSPLDIVEIDQIFVPPEGDVELKITLRGDPELLRFPLEQLRQIAELISKNPVRLEIQA
jgi:transcription antitermination factor NusA-like protein